MFLQKIQTPIGTMIACIVQDRLCMLDFDDSKYCYQSLNKCYEIETLETSNNNHPLFLEIQRQLNSYFEGKLKKFTIPLDIQGSTFQRKVWYSLLKIPYGVTSTYKQQSLLIKAPLSARAVAKAISMNRIAIIIPCHRVIGSNQKLTGYAGGLERKKYLLAIENQKPLFTL